MSIGLQFNQKKKKYTPEDVAKLSKEYSTSCMQKKKA
jgi:hypothetical protein